MLTISPDIFMANPPWKNKADHSGIWPKPDEEVRQARGASSVTCGTVSREWEQDLALFFNSLIEQAYSLRYRPED